MITHDNFDAYPSAYVPYVVRQIWDDLKTALATRDSFGPRTLTRAIVHARTLEGFKNLVNCAVPNHAQPEGPTSSRLRLPDLFIELKYERPKPVAETKDISPVSNDT